MEHPNRTIRLMRGPTAATRNRGARSMNLLPVAFMLAILASRHPADKREGCLGPVSKGSPCPDPMLQSRSKLAIPFYSLTTGSRMSSPKFDGKHWIVDTSHPGQPAVLRTPTHPRISFA